MKYILVLVALLPVCAMAQQISYSQFQQDAKTKINLRPEYGNVKKDQYQIADDQKFINEETKQSGDRRKASAEMVKLGFDYLYRGDLETSMKRFNQAWLLDPKNEDAYWGYGAVYFTFGDTNEALNQFKKGLSLNPSSSNILTDEATIYMSLYQNKHDLAYMDKAFALFIESYKIDPKNQNTLFKLSAAYFYKQDCTNAVKYYKECMLLGGKSISPGYADALKKQCGL
jgi:tetratricopeptide (TPR) repeat protein